MTEEEIGRMSAMVEATANEVHILRQGQSQLIGLVEKLAVMDSKFQDHHRSLDSAHTEIRAIKDLVAQRQSVIDWTLSCKNNLTKFAVGFSILAVMGIIGWALTAYRVINK